MARWGDNRFSVGFADQTVFDAEHSSPTWAWMKDATLPALSPAQEVTTLDTTKSADFEGQTIVPGTTQGGTLGFSVPLHSQLSTYDPSSGAPAENPEVQLLREIMGGVTTGTYDSGDVTSGSDANTVETTAGTYAPGDFYGFAAAATGALRCGGFVKSQATQTLTMLEDMRAVPVSGDHAIQFLTLYPGGTDPVFKTFRTTGSDTTQDVRVIGALPTACAINGQAGSGISLDFSYEFASPLQLDTSNGGLQSATKYLAVPPAMGVYNSRLWIDGVATQDGTLEADGTCGVGDFKVDLGIEYGRERCHGATWGVENLHVRNRTARVSFNIPHSSTYVSGGLSTWHNSLNDGTEMSVSLLVGTTIGQVFALAIPAAKVVEVANWGSNEGLLGWTVTMEPQQYTADGSSTNAGNSPIRIAIG